MKWLPWPSKSASPKFQVKVHGVKLRGFRFPDHAEHKSLELAMNLHRPRSSRVFSFRRTHLNSRSQVFSATADSMEWNPEFDAVCNFSESQPTSPSLRRPVLLSFTVLYGGSRESKAKRVILGTASLTMEKSASKMEADIPISLQVAGVATKATLSVSVSFMELSSGQDSTPLSQNAARSEHGDRRRAKAGFNPSPVGTDSSDDSALFDSDDPSAESTPSTESESGLSPGSDTQSDPVPETGFMSWKRRMVSFGPFGPGRPRQGPLIRNKTRGVNDGNNLRRKKKKKRSGVDWEVKEVESRDGQATLRAGVVFASFDQCSSEAAGEGACAALVAVVAHWLHSNQCLLPTRPQLDDLITQGSSEWRKLCDNQTYRSSFPNKHFDLDTVLKSDIRPLSICLDRSLVGFFSPEKFEPLKGTMSLEEMWKEIGGQSEDEETRVYIVSWNDHFFILIVEAEACYIIDSLGKRLFEGCSQAYILKFDESAAMYGKAAKKEGAINNEEREIICRGKECCREFIKRFLAAIQVRELEVEKKKKGVSHVDLYRRLQIDFHFTCLPSSSSSPPFASSVSATSSTSTSSLSSKEELFR